MPACVSCLIPAAASCASGALEQVIDCPNGLREALSLLPDPRCRRGRRHQVATVLTVAVAGILAGARSYEGIWAWAVDLPGSIKAGLGIRGRVPCESTIRRVVQSVDADLLDAVVCAWAAARQGDSRSPRAIAIDGKSARGARRGDGSRVHLMAALDHDTGTVLGQVQVGSKSSEINAFRPLLDRINITGSIVTADALHTQRGHVNYLRRHGGHYVFTVKTNQPRLHTQLATLPWTSIPVADTNTGKGHGRVETRTLKLTTVAAGIGFPGAKLAAQLTRTRRPLASQTTSTETVYAVTDLGYDDITPSALAAVIRGHWSIENRLHWVRDTTFAEDHSQVRTGHGPQVMATLRNLAVSLHRHSGAVNIAAAARAIAHRPERVLALVT